MSIRTLTVVTGVLCAAGSSAVADIERGGPGIRYSLELAITAASWDALGDSSNTILTFDLSELLVGSSGLIMSVDALEWDLNVETFGASWLSEASLALRSADGVPGQAVLTPGLGFDAPGEMAFSSAGEVSLDPGDVLTLPTGVLEVEVFEGFDDIPDAIDAFMTGTITVHGFAIPSPGAITAVLSLGVVASRRRRASCVA